MGRDTHMCDKVECVSLEGSEGIIKSRPVDADYKLIEKIGEGKYAEVWRAEKDGRQYAVKLIDKADSGVKVTDKEIEVMRRIRNDNEHCVQLYAVYETDEEVQMVLELLEGHDLFDRIISLKRYTEPDAKRLLKAICRGVKGLHDKQCIHRDLKPENILLLSEDDHCNAKVADFGLSRLFPEGSARQMKAATLCGTPGYVAPEVLERVPYSYGVDVWSLGVIAYVTVAGFPPFPLDMDRESIQKVRNADFSFPSPYWDGVSAECRDFISQMLVREPTRRATMDRVLAHPWLDGA